MTDHVRRGEAIDAAILSTALLAFMRTHGPMELVLRAETVLELAAALQLAKRHPRADEHPTVLAAIERFLTGAREYFADCPPMLEALRQGDDPRYDR